MLVCAQRRRIALDYISWPNDQVHQQAQKKTETPTEADACSVLRTCSPVGCMEVVGNEGLGMFAYIGYTMPETLKNEILSRPTPVLGQAGFVSLLHYHRDATLINRSDSIQ